MTPGALETLIRTGIPVADFMRLSVRAVEPDRVLISAPLEPNRNVHGTLFGGSGTAIALVAAWSLVVARMHAEGLTAPLVVARQTTQYFKPVTDTVMASASFEGAWAWEGFRQAVAQGQRARVGVVVTLEQTPGDVAARIEALFAAVPAKG
ncbi:MAG: hypothetical protein EBS47_06940 [Betaproteobacteria bacterium]|nr:hypothetical protein [Betaproteobacteria bacterium]NBU49829.1 hypothetical protein [Betaproteobacteria bacterium]